MTKHTFLKTLAPLALLAATAVLPAGVAAQAAPPGLTTSGPAASSDAPLPNEMVVIDIDAPQNQSFRIGIVDFFGPKAQGSEAGAVLRNDFTIMPGYKVLDLRQITHDVAGEGLAIHADIWGRYQANGVIKGQISDEGGGNFRADARFFWLAKGEPPVLSKTYRGPAKDLRKWMHDFANEVLLTLTGLRGPFGTKITFARKQGPGSKDVFCSQMDGYNVMRVSAGKGISMLPTFEPSGNIWYTRLTDSGMFITRSGLSDRPVVSGNGVNMGPEVCNGRMFFTSSRDGNSEIYSTRLDGTDLKRLTNNPAIDTSPACGPDNKLAFVSARHGTPQIFVMGQDGSNPTRVTYRGTHNQTPVWCQNGVNKNLIAFTGRDGTLDIFTLDIGTQEYSRLTQGQGMNKDPAFSPDCRILAFTSDRRGAPGIYLSSTKGNNQVRVVEGVAETVRWHH